MDPKYIWVHIGFICVLFFTWSKPLEGRTTRNGCIHILSYSTKHDKVAESSHSYGIQATAKRASLGRHPDSFRLKAGGFLGKKGTFGIESVKHRGFYLRQKNFKFFLEKPSKNPSFAKDASFHLVKLQEKPVLYGIELDQHPSWFMKHDKANKFHLTLGHVKTSNEDIKDTAFVLRRVRCKNKDHSEVQKKTIVAGSNTEIERNDDNPDYVNDDLNGIEFPDDIDQNSAQSDSSAEPTKSKSDGATAPHKENVSEEDRGDTIIEVVQEPKANPAVKEREILKELKNAFKLVHSKKNNQSLQTLQKDIDSKVDKLATDLQQKKGQQTFRGSSGLHPEQNNKDQGLEKESQQHGQNSLELDQKDIEELAKKIETKKHGKDDFGKQFHIQGPESITGPNQQKKNDHKEIEESEKNSMSKLPHDQKTKDGLEHQIGFGSDDQEPVENKSENNVKTKQENNKEESQWNSFMAKGEGYENDVQSQNQQPLQEGSPLSNQTSKLHADPGLDVDISTEGNEPQSNDTDMNLTIKTSGSLKDLAQKDDDAETSLSPSGGMISGKPESVSPNEVNNSSVSVPTEDKGSPDKVVGSAGQKISSQTDKMVSGVPETLSFEENSTKNNGNDHTNQIGNGNSERTSEDKFTTTTQAHDKNTPNTDSSAKQGEQSLNAHLSLNDEPTNDKSTNDSKHDQGNKHESQIIKEINDLLSQVSQAKQVKNKVKPDDVQNEHQSNKPDKPVSEDLKEKNKKDKENNHENEKATHDNDKLSADERETHTSNDQLKPNRKEQLSDEQEHPVKEHSESIHKDGRLLKHANENSKTMNTIVTDIPKLLNDKYEVIARGIVARLSIKNKILTNTSNPIIKKRMDRLVNILKEKLKARLRNETLKSIKLKDFHSNHSVLLPHNEMRSNYTSASSLFAGILKNENGSLFQPTIFFSEKCGNVYPKECEIWAKKMYCLTFNELMKRYCKKACNLCDHVVTTGFTECSKTCGSGVKLRMIKINNRQVLQKRSCNRHHCPVNGGYTPFSNFTECSATCGDGLRYKHRTCTQPPPQYGGEDCSRLGSPIKTKSCFIDCKEKLLSDQIEEEKHVKAYHRHHRYHHRKHNNQLFSPNTNSAESDDNNDNNISLDKTDTETSDVSTSQDTNNKQERQEYKVYKTKCKPGTRPRVNKPYQASYQVYDSGRMIYDKYGMPVRSTNQVVQQKYSPYKLTLRQDNNNKMSVSEDCILDGDSPLSDVNSEVNKKLQKQGFYEYGYGDPNIVKKEANQAANAVGKALDDDSLELSRSSFMQGAVSDSPKHSLSDELNEEKKLVMDERRYEEGMARNTLS